MSAAPLALTIPGNDAASYRWMPHDADCVLDPNDHGSTVVDMLLAINKRGGAVYKPLKEGSPEEVTIKAIVRDDDPKGRWRAECERLSGDEAGEYIRLSWKRISCKRKATPRTESSKPRKQAQPAGAGAGKKKRKPKSGFPEKKPLTVFLKYLADHMPAYKANNPGVPHKDAVGAMSEQWREIPNEEKEKMKKEVKEATEAWQEREKEWVAAQAGPEAE